MFDLILFLGFSTLIVRFSKAMNRMESTLDRTAHFVEDAHNKLKRG